MKRFILYLLFIITFANLFAQESYHKKVQAFLNYTTYYSPANGPYVEFYLSIIPEGLTFTTNENYPFDHAKVSILLLLTNEDKENGITNFSKINMIIPKDSIISSDNVFSHLFVMNVAPGIYKLEVKLRDEYDTLTQSIFESNLYVSTFDTISFSGIQLLHSYTPVSENDDLEFVKGDYKFNYRPINILSENDSLLLFYFEIYNTAIYDTNKYFLLCVYLEDLQNRQILEKYYLTKKMSTDDVIGFMGNFNVAKLPSGRYALVAEAINKNNEVVANVQLPIYVDHPSIMPYEIIKTEVDFLSGINNLDTLHEYLRTLSPISSSVELEIIKKHIKSTDTNEIKKFLYSFWVNRDKDNPKKAWENYLEQVKLVNNAYSTQIRKGYMTDRGRVYLRYGPPNTIVRNENEPNAYPYEIWHYHHVNGENNRRFVFYNPSLTYNNYELLHSDVRGEYNNPNWRQRLARKIYASGNPEEDDPDFGWGSKVNDYFDNPR